MFYNKFIVAQHNLKVATINSNYTVRWIGMISETFSLIVISATVYFAVLSKTFNIMNS